MSKNSLKGAISSKQSTETQVWWEKKTMPSCKFSLGPIHWYGDGSLNISKPLIVHLVGDPKISNLLIPIDSSIYIYIYMFSILDIFWHVFSPFFGTLRPGAHPSGQAQGQAVMGESQKSLSSVGLLSSLATWAMSRCGRWWYLPFGYLT